MRQTMEHSHLRLLNWWTDDPMNPGRLPLTDPDVQQLLTAISSDSSVIDLGGVMSLNVKLNAPGLVLRVHQPFVSRQRLLALQNVRCRLANLGLVVPVPLHWNHSAVFRCKNRWAELESYLPHERLAPTLDSYTWLFRTMGTLHHALKQLDLEIPRPLVATYAPPGSLQRWLPITEAAVKDDPKAADVAHLLRKLVRQLQGQWIPVAQLPTQFVHGDIRLSNVCRAFVGDTIYFDFGFLAWRPRIHDLAYALLFMIFALGEHQIPDRFARGHISRLIGEYEATANVRLTTLERKALAPYTASVALYAAALDGFTENPSERLQSRLPFLHLSAWLLAHPDALSGK